VTNAGVSRMNDANDANANLRSIGLPPFPCLAVMSQRPVVVERDPHLSFAWEPIETD
jgi:hypothetical protein